MRLLIFSGVKMPRKPKRPCSHPGCPELVDGRFCKKHEKEYNKNYEKYKRDPKTYKRYGKAWRVIRKRYVAEHPLCEMCLKENRMTKVEEVHHMFLFLVVELMTKTILWVLVNLVTQRFMQRVGIDLEGSFRGEGEP